MLALIKNNAVVSQVAPGGWYMLPNGDHVTPTDGWDNGEHKFLEIQPSDPVPDDMEVVSLTVKMVNGKPKYVAELRPLPLPDRVTSRQFMLQMLVPMDGYPNGIYDAVTAWVSAQDKAVQIAFQHSGTFVRSEPMMQAGFAALNFTEEQGDAFFLAASKL